MNKYANLRDERVNREINRFEKMESYDAQQQNVITAKRDYFNAGKKNQGGSAYNLINLDYDQNDGGKKLAQVEDDARVRALIRARNMNDKGNGRFNILTGEEKGGVQVPTHERYNPITQAGSQILNNGQPGSRQSQHRVPSSQGVVPGLY